MEKYTVMKGDTLWKIAKKHNTSLEALIAANPQIGNINALGIGIKINIPQNPSPVILREFEAEQDCGICNRMMQERPFIYTADGTDTIAGIAESFGLAATTLLGCNPQINTVLPLEAGLKVLIPGLDPALSAEQVNFCYMSDDEDGGNGGGDNDGDEGEQPPADIPEGTCCCPCPYCGRLIKLSACVKR